MKCVFVFASWANAVQLSPTSKTLTEHSSNIDAVEYRDDAYMPSQGDLFKKVSGAYSLTNEANRLISGTSFNPSLIDLPEAVAKSLHPQAVFLATLRHHCTCQCGNLGKNVTARPYIHHESSVALLDKNLEILALAEIPQGEDMRLLSAGDHILSSYGMPKSRWHFAELALGGNPQTGNFTVDFVGINLTKSHRNHIMFKLSRNIGVIAHKNEEIYLVKSVEADVAGPFFSRHENQGLVFHNNVNPLLLPEFHGYLGVAHSHIGYGSPASYGKNYNHAFFLLDDKPPFKMLKTGSMFCMPALRSEHSHDECEIIQFIGSINRDPQDPKVLLIAYGINDCEAAVVRLPLQDVMDSLVDVSGDNPNFGITATRA